MADELDRASGYEELERLSAFNKISKRPMKEAEATGCCLYCGEALPGDLRWCDAECRDDWELERQRRSV